MPESALSAPPSVREPRSAAARVRLVDERGGSVCPSCEVARSLWRRGVGLLGRRRLEEGAGLLLPSTSSIHTFFMRFPIDVVFLDREMRIRRVVHDLRPFRLAAARGRGSVLELPAGAARAARLEPGMRLALAGQKSSTPPNQAPPNRGRS